MKLHKMIMTIVVSAVVLAPLPTLANGGGGGGGGTAFGQDPAAGLTIAERQAHERFKKKKAKQASLTAQKKKPRSVR